MHPMSLKHGTTSERLFATSLLALLGLGYVMALVYLFSSELLPHIRAGRGFVAGISRTYHGGEGETRLEAVLKGPMAFAARSEDLARVQQWIQGGATREGFRALEPLVSRKCAHCHQPGQNPPLVRNYDEVRLLLQRDGGKPVQALARTTHVHLFTVPLMLFPLGFFFLRTRYSERLKCLLIVLPFAALVWDIAHWWITRFFPAAAWGVLFGGMAFCLAFASQWALTLWDVWAPCSSPEAAPGPPAP